MTSDALFRDTVFGSSNVLPGDTIPLCLKYRVAIRNNVQDIGPTYRYAQITAAPKSYVTTFFTATVRHAELGCDSASINDTVILSVSAQNMTRPLRTVAWYDPKTRDTIAIISSDDSLARELSDTIRYSFDSVGINRIQVLVTDNAGKKWMDTIPVKIVRDAPVVNAGNDTGVFVNDPVHLHGSATQRFGTITKWEWKIGEGSWITSSGPDTMIIAPETEQTMVCSLAVTDDDGNRVVDEMKIVTSYKVKGVAAGWGHSLILKTNGTLWACGYNKFGPLGDGTTTDRFTPVQTVSDVQGMAAGYKHSLILKTDGTLWACGSNNNGQLGDGTTTNRTTPVQVMSDVQSMAAGSYHSLILKADGSLWACGYNGHGQLGDGTTTNRTTPVQVMSDVQSMAAGFFHSLILKADGTLWGCGDNQDGELGDGTMTDQLTPVQIMDSVQSIDAGNYYSMILKTDATLWACGYNPQGELGNGTTSTQTTFVQIMSNVQSMAAGHWHSLIIKTDGTLWACGLNNYGQLGCGITKNQITPVQIMSNIQRVDVGVDYSLFLKPDGTLWGCGDNRCGQLGDGTTTARYTPVRIVPPQTVTGF